VETQTLKFRCLWVGVDAVAIVKMFIVVASLSSCATLHGTYTLKAVDANGDDALPRVSVTTDGSSVHSIRSALCKSHPGATILITNVSTGQPLTGESLYKCHK